ncbi:sulfotransferase domain-containing protein [Candidatus Woesearchaeota archaeon]|nr:sulfotransferase domain-containing protein [Candidatus Woesearchaeota archaeon]
MKVLIYGLQSSGASLVTYFLAQKNNSIAITDLFNCGVAPNLDSIKEVDNLFVKCTVNSKIQLEKHIASFKPDKVILVVRNPFDNYVSLINKWYGSKNSSVEDKFKTLEKYFSNYHFDLILRYEDLIYNKSRVIKQLKKFGIKVKKEYYEFRKNKEEIFKFNSKHLKKLNIGNFYGGGNIHPYFKKIKIDSSLVSKKITNKQKEKVRELCPKLCRYYEKKKKNIFSRFFNNLIRFHQV